MRDRDAAVGLRRFLPNTQSDAWGYVRGCVLALGAFLSFATARTGVVACLSPGHLILMRFGISGLFLLPFWVGSSLPVRECAPATFHFARNAAWQSPQAAAIWPTAAPNSLRSLCAAAATRAFMRTRAAP